MPAPATRREVIVDADGHICEPPDLWEKNLPVSMREHALRLRWDDATGYDRCLIEDWVATDRGLAGLGNAGLPYTDLGRGMHYEDLNPAGFDPHERVKVLDAEGIDICVAYPGLALKLGGIKDPALMTAHCQVYNDWLAEWCSARPDRLVGVGALPMCDPAAAVIEAHRIADLGLRGGYCRPNPHHGHQLHERIFDPVYEALVERGIPLTFHPAGPWDMDGASRRMRDLMAPGTHHAVILLFDQYLTLSNFAYGGVFERHPDLQVVTLECGGGWICHWIDRMDEFYDDYAWMAETKLTLKPSEYFARQGWISFDPGEKSMAAMAALAPSDRLIWASDFPHSDAKYPGVVEELHEHTAEMTPDDRAGLLGTNALRMYGIEHMAQPFTGVTP